MLIIIEENRLLEDHFEETSRGQVSFIGEGKGK
jgi:hypothetical protein